MLPTRTRDRLLWLAVAVLSVHAVVLHWSMVQDRKDLASREKQVPDVAVPEQWDTPYGPADPWTVMSFFEWEKRWSSFVSNRPDLSGPISEGGREAITEHIRNLLAPVGVEMEQIDDLRWAVGQWGTTLVRCRLSGEQMQRFVSEKMRLAEPPRVLVSFIYDTGKVKLRLSETSEATIDFSRLQSYPFVRLSWWPVPRTELDGGIAYLGEMTWSFRELHSGAPYLVVTQDDGSAYVLCP
mgnify:CR=1 FL=1